MELILSLLIARWLMAAAGDTTPLTAPQFAGLGLGSGGAGGPARDYRVRAGRAAIASRPIRAGGPGLLDRLANLRASLTNRARVAAERQYDRVEQDRAQRERRSPDTPDERTRWQRFTDQRRTCPDCGHGGVVGYRHDCTCTACRCRFQSAPYWGPGGRPDPEPPARPAVPDVEGDPPPAPSGGDGPAASDDPTRPTPKTAGPAQGPEDSTDEGTDPMTAPVSPTAPIAPAARGPVSPGSPTGGGSIAPQGTGALPALDPSDIRFSDARQHLGVYSANLGVMVDGLGAREVDAQTRAKIADAAALMKSIVADINREYGPVEQAINDSRHVAQRDTYLHR